MAKQKKKLSPAQKAARKKRRKEYMTIFVHGKQKRVKKPVTINGMDIDEFIRQNADPIWLHQNEMWEYMEPIEKNYIFSLDDKDEEGLRSAKVSNMKIHLGYVSASVAGDYYQVYFKESEDSDQSDIDGKYLLIQRQFEIPDGDKIYVESHNLDFIGHFKVVKAKLNPRSLSLTLSKKKTATIEVDFESSPKNYSKIKRALKVMIPNIEIENER